MVNLINVHLARCTYGYAVSFCSTWKDRYKLALFLLRIARDSACLTVVEIPEAELAKTLSFAF